MMLVILASAMALFRATLSSDDPLFPTDGTAGGPHPVNGVWAALPADCAAPTTLELSLWPKCATPVGFLDGEVAALQKPAADSRPAPDQFTSIARTHYWSVSGTPVVVQVDVPIMFSHSTIYIALQPDGLDRTNGFTAATGMANRLSADGGRRCDPRWSAMFGDLCCRRAGGGGFFARSRQDLSSCSGRGCSGRSAARRAAGR